MRTCSKCGVAKELEAFRFKTKGNSQRRTQCNLCSATYVKLWRKNNPEKVSIAMNTWRQLNRKRITTTWDAWRKKNAIHIRMRRYTHKDRARKLVEPFKAKSCTDCGGMFSAVSMQFDHLPQYEKRANISSLVANGSSDKLVLDELAKCELVCANCHEVRTTIRRAAVPLSEAAGAKYSRQYRKSAQELVTKHKENPCKDCGRCFPACAMQFDHLPQHAKAAAISKLVARGASSHLILAEIANCELVCANCHAVRTHIRQQAKIVEVA